MNVVAVYTNQKRDEDLKITNNFIEVAENTGLLCKIIKTDDFTVSLTEVDCLVVFGGDGTILSCVSGFKDLKPILGINIGKFGFLAETTVLEIKKVAHSIKNNKFFIEKRSMIEASLLDGRGFLALNEIVVKDSDFHTAHLKVFIDKKLYDEYASDGVIISTPTGSTAYSLSAGGPILSPDVDALIINPINAHSLHSRPYVVSDKSIIEISATERSRELNLVADGRLKSVISNDDIVTIKKSKKFVEFMRLQSYDFHSRVLNKFNKKI